jgi:Lysozyme like domain
MEILVAIAGLGVIFAILYASGNDLPNTIAGYAKNAGFSGFDLGVAVAIAYAESSGNESAIGDVDLGVSVGLWQINLAAHPEYSQDELLDPQTNANAAFAIYSAAGNSFSPWTTFNNGAYQNYSQQAQDQTGIDIGDSDDDE